MRRFVSLLFVVVALMTALTSIGFAQGGKTIYTRGTFDFQPNVRIWSNLRFSPGPITVKSGETVTVVHADRTTEPHTISLVDLSDLGSTPDELFNNPVGGAVFADHGVSGPVVDNGAPGADTIYDYDPITNVVTPGDSWFILDDESVSFQVSAPAGTTLGYFCAIHPWMQGTISVR